MSSLKTCQVWFLGPTLSSITRILGTVFMFYLSDISCPTVFLGSWGQVKKLVCLLRHGLKVLSSVWHQVNADFVSCLPVDSILHHWLGCGWSTVGSGGCWLAVTEQASGHSNSSLGVHREETNNICAVHLHVADGSLGGSCLGLSSWAERDFQAVCLKSVSRHGMGWAFLLALICFLHNWWPCLCVSAELNVVICSVVWFD